MGTFWWLFLLSNLLLTLKTHINKLSNISDDQYLFYQLCIIYTLTPEGTHGNIQEQFTLNLNGKKEQKQNLSEK